MNESATGPNRHGVAAIAAALAMAGTCAQTNAGPFSEVTQNSYVWTSRDGYYIYTSVARPARAPHIVLDVS